MPFCHLMCFVSAVCFQTVSERVNGRGAMTARIGIGVISFAHGHANLYC